MALAFLAGCSSWQGSQSDSGTHQFLSYNSTKDLDYSGAGSRLPSSAKEKDYWCDSPHETNFVSYGNDKEYYASDSAQALVCH